MGQNNGLRDSSVLKSLTSQLRKLEGERDGIVLQKKSLDDDLALKVQQIKTIHHKMKLLRGDGVLVSEHALLRYMERVMKIDLSQLEKEILTDSVLTQQAALGDGEYPSSGFSVKIRDSVVVTVLVPNMDGNGE